MSVQDGHPLVYRGILGFDSKEKCLEESVKAENIMFDMEMKKGKDGYQEEATYPPGTILTGDEFPEEIIENWVEIGVLEKIKPKPKKKKKPKSQSLNNFLEPPIEDGE